MKLNSLLTILCSVVFLLTSCQKEIVDEFETPSDFILETFDKVIFEDVYTPKEAYNALSIKFNYPIDTVFSMNVDGVENNFRIYFTVEFLSDPEIEIETFIYNQDSLVLCPPLRFMGYYS